MRKLLILATCLLVSSSLLAEDVEHRFQSSVARGQVQRIRIDIPFGSFTVRNGVSSRIALSGVTSRDYDGQRERIWAQGVVDDTSVEVTINGAEAVIRRRFGRNASSWRARKFTGLDLRLELPPGVDVEFTTSAGEVTMDGDFGDVSLDLRAGEFKLRTPRASVRELNASCRVGEVRANLGTEIVSREGLFPGRIHFFNATGKTHVNVHVTAGEVDVALTQ
ncbi:MAG: hypothetical protein ABI779_03770 [Acidobacteriota bacterium]